MPDFNVEYRWLISQMATQAIAATWNDGAGKVQFGVTASLRFKEWCLVSHPGVLSGVDAKAGGLNVPFTIYILQNLKGDETMHDPICIDLETALGRKTYTFRVEAGPKIIAESRDVVAAMARVLFLYYGRGI